MTHSMNRRRFLTICLSNWSCRTGNFDRQPGKRGRNWQNGRAVDYSRFPGDNAGAKSAKALAAHLKAGRAGGVLFLRHNVKSGKQARAMAAQFLNAANGCLNAIDQEGGKVQRLGKKQGFSAIPTAKWVAANKSLDEARALYRKAGAELRAAGFNFNMAPSVDIHDPKNPVIGRYGRGFSNDVERIAAYAGAFVDGFKSAGVACSLKHFPRSRFLARG